MREAFYLIARRVEALKPGQEICVSSAELWTATPSMEYNGARFSPPDQVLENIVGSAYEFSWREDFKSRDIIFRRHPAPVRGHFRRYVSPDRRDCYHEDRMTGLFRHRTPRPEIGPPIPANWHLCPAGREFLFDGSHESNTRR